MDFTRRNESQEGNMARIFNIKRRYENIREFDIFLINENVNNSFS